MTTQKTISKPISKPGRTRMYLMNEELARAQQHERLEAAHSLMLVRQAKIARKAARRADRAAQQARLAIARQL